MQYNVAQLLKEPIGATREYELDEDIRELDAELVPLSNLTGWVHMLRTHSGILVEGEFQVRLQVLCSRCAEPVEIAVQFRLEESFHPLTQVDTGRFIRPDEFQGTEEELLDAALLINEQHILDLREVMRQNIWLALPMVPGCVFGDPSQCPAYQRRLEEMRAVHSDLEEADEVATVDPRWAALLELRGQQ